VLDRAADRLDDFAPWGEAPVLLACSGGADSTFLAVAWRHAAERASRPGGDRHERACAPLPAARCAVVDHGHRAGSAADAAHAAEALAALGFEVEVLRATAAPDANEAILRDARYALLREAARACGASRVLTAHHADDLAETVLLRILRGTGLRGLAGIPARRPLGDGVEVLRPLLGLRRADLRAALTAVEVSWLEDPTNALPHAARNRLRQEVLPAMARVATGDPVLAVLRLAGEAGEWSEALDALLGAAGDWRMLPGYLRRQAVAVELRRLGETVSPARLRDLESALMRKGRAGVSTGAALRVVDGRLAPV
jgi:tRNA(Ile)-lysidine synthase